MSHASDKLGSLEEDRETLTQEYNEMMLRYLALLHAEDEANLLLEFQQEDEEEFARPQLDQAVCSMIRAEKQKTSAKIFWRGLQRYGSMAAVFVCVCALGFATLFFTVDAVKLNVVDFMMRTFEESTEFSFADVFDADHQRQESPELTPENFRKPTYVPKDYEEAYSQLTSTRGTVTYHTTKPPKQKAEREGPEIGGNISYTCLSINVTMALDTEDSTKEKTSVNGNEAYLYTKYRGMYKGKSTVVWHDEAYVYLIHSDVSRKETMKIAESVK